MRKRDLDQLLKISLRIDDLHQMFQDELNLAMKQPNTRKADINLDMALDDAYQLRELFQEFADRAKKVLHD